MHAKAPMLGNYRRHLRRVDLFGVADKFARKILMQDLSTAHATVRTMLDNRVRVVAQHTAMTFVAWLGTARLGLLASLLVVRRRWLGRNA